MTDQGTRPPASAPHVVYVVDPDPSVRSSVSSLVRAHGFEARSFESAEAFLEHLGDEAGGCLITEVHLSGMSGIQLQQCLNESGVRLPVIVLASDADVTLAVKSMRRGAIDFIQKPFVGGILLERVRQALESDTADVSD